MIKRIFHLLSPSQKDTDGLLTRASFLEQENARLVRENGDLRTEVSELRAEIAELRKEIARLLAMVNKNSQNSSKPPSSDGLKKPRQKSLREKSGRRSGGQNGHPGKTLSHVDNPDEVKIHQPEVCSACNISLKNIEAHEEEVRQVFEIPPPKLEVIEHRCEKKICPGCGKQNVGVFPVGVDSHVQYGPLAKGFITYLQNYQLIPFKRLSQFFKDVFGSPLSEGTVFNTANTAYKNLASFESHVAELLVHSDILHADETGLKVNKKLYWLHSVSTDLLTHYSVHEKRGCEAMDAAGILPRFKGTLIHDCWAPYFNYGFKHALCNAHLLRELNAVIETTDQVWAKEMGDLLRAANKATKECENGAGLSADEIIKFTSAYGAIVYRGYTETGGLKPEEKTFARNLWERFILRDYQVLEFIHDPEVSFDNNLAERDIRMTKVKQKISGCYRSKTSADHFARIRSYISTARKHGLNILEALQDVFNGNPFTPTA
jgi:transposase/uncharacterized small protein (DUF1192 family)